jgi:hypothetical protein
MSASLLLTVGALCLCLQGCPEIDGTKTQPQTVKQPYQRFIPIHREPGNLTGVPWSGAFALDTKTGMLCRTYATEDNGEKDKWAALDLCFDLYKRFPD